jgi:Uma2 family endonuclease
MLDEIVLPITKPETEWVRGRARPKVSPTFDHSRVQTCLVIALEAWSAGRGRVGTEWRFRLAPEGEARRPLVPDVAYVRIEALRAETREDIQAPSFAPDVAVEVLSPKDLAADVADKVDVYLRCGTQLVIVADPRRRRITLYDRSSTRILEAGHVLRHEALPGFELAVGPLFARALDL